MICLEVMVRPRRSKILSLIPYFNTLLPNPLLYTPYSNHSFQRKPFNHNDLHQEF